tara:strand:+ start:7067 stop:7426 length:360 start_codon:yes stop_codon:yes gene_type:complete
MGTVVSILVIIALSIIVWRIYTKNKSLKTDIVLLGGDIENNNDIIARSEKKYKELVSNYVDLSKDYQECKENALIRDKAESCVKEEPKTKVKPRQKDVKLTVATKAKKTSKTKNTSKSK